MLRPGGHFINFTREWDELSRDRRIAQRMPWAWAPAVPKQMKAFFGVGDHREAKLEQLRINASLCPQLERSCSKLVAYSFPRETARTQVQAFKSTVSVITRHLGTQALILESKHLGRGNTVTAIAALWARADG
ncbi:hypothetical protein C8R44DRAFT_873040 [Mycena epipterygia]|nr:hypothetical protein C8R44DRAFT_873040 [Mycena epipterygia]